MAINTELLEKVKAHILAEPRRYDQEVVAIESSESPCGTAACLYGWGATLGGLVPLEKLKEWEAYLDEETPLFNFSDVSRLFGFNDAEEEIVSNYQGEEWPYRFGSALRTALYTGDKEGQAKAAADYIDWIITTGKVTE